MKGQLQMNANAAFSVIVAGLTVAGAARAADGLQPLAPLPSRVVNTTLRLPSSPPSEAAEFPLTLADTGAFADLRTLTPHAGIVPIELNVPLWSDGAHKRRWFCLPGTNRIAFSREGQWLAPIGTVWIKHFEIELTNGVPESTHRLETRFLVRTAEGVYGVTYRWGDSRTNAVLVPEEGMDEQFVVQDGNTARSQRWHYPAQAECRACHSQGAGYSLGFNTAQFNRDGSSPDGPQNQIHCLSDMGYFDTEVTSLNTLRALAHPTNSAVSLEYRARSYLAANCVHCHQPGGICPTPWNAVLTNSLADTHLVNGALWDDLGDPQNRVIKPGDLDLSVLFQRISRRGDSRQMPMLCTTVVDTQGVALIAAWITNELPRYQSFADWQVAHFKPPGGPDSAQRADPDHDGASNYLEYLTATDPHSAKATWRIWLQRTERGVAIRYPRIARRGFEVEWTTNVADPVSWQPLDVPANRPFFAAEPQEAVVEDTDAFAPLKFYRVRVYQP